MLRAPIAGAAMLEALGSDVVRTARANGLPTTTILLADAFRNALLPIGSVLGTAFSFLLGSNVQIGQVLGGGAPVPMRSRP